MVSRCVHKIQLDVSLPSNGAFPMFRPILVLTVAPGRFQMGYFRSQFFQFCNGVLVVNCNFFRGNSFDQTPFSSAFSSLRISAALFACNSEMRRFILTELLLERTICGCALRFLQ